VPDQPKASCILKRGDVYDICSIFLVNHTLAASTFAIIYISHPINRTDQMLQFSMRVCVMFYLAEIPFSLLVVVKP